MLGLQQPDNFSHVRRDLAVERIGFLDVDARTFVADDDVALNEHHGVFGQYGSMRRVRIRKHVQRE